ncbi:glycosyltransferase family 4 protein [Paenibacillus sacheonensis]|uniref:Glycosyltransferase n=1 Tax=Paenibacillus sacheonensis TaxID=742054 RepID=A0A7X4YUA3_9BACL|nr:glycosyltransferase family 4 protein [Paenibacillus sacheonensis]MBM7566730.1 spore coat protein SA [Paenibacillus sacheonensis]NBC71694.1 glycosyltransferase [Paenibacillus sacheonensis]
MDKPKVAFVTPGTFPLPSPTSSSVERVVEKTVPLLVPYVDAHIYGRLSRSLGKRGNVGGAAIERFPAASKQRYIQCVRRAVGKLRLDVLQVENRPRYVLKLKQAQPAKQIWLNLHSNTFIRERAIPSQTLSRCFHAADRIIVNSEFLKEDAANRVPGCAHKLCVVYPGVDVERFPSQYSAAGSLRRAELRRRRNWLGRSVVLFMGRLQEIKGVHHLLKLMPQLIKEHPSVLLVIVGGAFYGSNRTTAYVRMLHRLGRTMKGHVTFVPYVPYSEVPSWFLGADVAVVPSGNREAFGLVNVEAMACGLPVVATRAGGMKEIIDDGVTGYLVDPEHVVTEMRSRLLELLCNERLRQEMGCQSRKRVEQHFTWQHSANRWLELLREP